MVFEIGQTSNNKIQLFISFRGHDERLKLLPHLKHHLRKSKVNVFVDADNIGEPLTNLFEHIRNSRIVIVIFSINYLESYWCLDELVHIKKCLFTKKIDFAIPIFYNVDASHVKDQSGDFGRKFLALQEKHPESIKRWKKALIFVANYGGLTYDKNGLISELDFIKTVVDHVDKVLTKITSKEGDNSYNNSISNKKSEEEAANLAKFDIVMDDMNRLYHVSEALEALDLERRSIEEYNKAIYLKELSRINPPYIEEVPWTLDDNLPHDWPHLEHRRANSFPDNIYQIYPPLSDERTIVQYHPVVNQVSNGNIKQNETIEVQNHSVINQVSNNTIQQDETTVVQNHPVINEVSEDNTQQDDMRQIQTPAVSQVSINKKDLQRECYEKRNEDINCVVFMWYCFKLWLSRR